MLDHLYVHYLVEAWVKKALAVLNVKFVFIFLRKS